MQKSVKTVGGPFFETPKIANQQDKVNLVVC